MNVVDSSAWLEYLGDGPVAPEFAVAIENPHELVVPTLTMFEVYKRTCQLADEVTASQAIGLMLQGRVIELSATLAIEAARISLHEKLSLADSIVLATARSEGAVLWTQDAHFANLDGVEFRAKPAG